MAAVGVLSRPLAISYIDWGERSEAQQATIRLLPPGQIGLLSFCSFIYGIFKDGLNKSPRRVHLRSRSVCGVANPRHSDGYGCGLRLASHPDPQRTLTARLIQAILKKIRVTVVSRGGYG